MKFKPDLSIPNKSQLDLKIYVIFIHWYTFKHIYTFPLHSFYIFA